MQVTKQWRKVLLSEQGHKLCSRKSKYNSSIKKQKTSLQKYDEFITSKYLTPLTKEPIRVLALSWILADMAKPIITAMHVHKDSSTDSSQSNSDTHDDSKFAAIASNIGFSLIHIVVYWGLYFAFIGTLRNTIGKKLLHKVSKQTRDFTVEVGAMTPLTLINAILGTTWSAQIAQWLITQRKNGNPFITQNPIFDWLMSLGEK